MSIVCRQGKKCGRFLPCFFRHSVFVKRWSVEYRDKQITSHGHRLNDRCHHGLKSAIPTECLVAVNKAEFLTAPCCRFPNLHRCHTVRLCPLLRSMSLALAPHLRCLIASLGGKGSGTLMWCCKIQSIRNLIHKLPFVTVNSRCVQQRGESLLNERIWPILMEKRAVLVVYKRNTASLKTGRLKQA